MGAWFAGDGTGSPWRQGVANGLSSGAGSRPSSARFLVSKPFGECQSSGENHPLQTGFRGNSLAPNVALHALDELQLLGCEVDRNDVAVVDVAEGIVVLSIVEIEESEGAEHDLVAHGC